MKRILKKYLVIILLLISLVPLINLTSSGLPVTHDGQDHVARIANFYRSLTEGNIVPRWAGNLNWGYGHPILMFLYPFSSYVASLFHFVGFSLIDSTKLVFAVSYIASIAFMYLWVSSAWGKTAGAVSAVLYGFAPYRFVDLYVRGAIGEHAAFVFPPLICYGLYRLADAERGKESPGFALASLGTALLILAHNALSILFLACIACYAVYLAWFETKRKRAFLLWSITAIGMGFILSAFFWVPAFFEGKYTLRDIVTGGVFVTSFVPIWEFFYSPWSYGYSPMLSKWLGLGQIIAAVLAVIAAMRTKLTKDRAFVMVSLVGIAGAMYLMTAWSKSIWLLITLLQKFQFPWRLLSVTTFLLAALGPFTLKAARPRYRFVLAGALIVLTILPTVQMWRGHAYKSYGQGYFTGIYDGTTDTGESAPIWSVRFMEQRPATPMGVISGEASIHPEIRTSVTHTYRVDAKTPVRLVENTLYFPGWTVTSDGRALPLQFQDPAYRGLMTFELPEGEHEIRVVFRETKLRVFADAASIIGIILLTAILGTIPLWQQKRK